MFRRKTKIIELPTDGPRHPEAEVRLTPGKSVGQVENSYFPSFLAGQVFNQLREVGDDERGKYLRRAMKIDDADDAIAFAAQWITVIDAGGFKV